MPEITYQHCYCDHLIYDVNIDGSVVNVTVTSTPAVVRKWISTTLFLRRYIVDSRRLVVGLGVQWSPYTSDPDPPADILTLCVGSRCLIFQLSEAASAPLILRNFLRNPNHTFVGFWNHSDRRKLESSYHCLDMFADPLDLRHVVDDCDDDGLNLKQASVNEIVEACLGFNVDQRKDVSYSDWDAEVLSNEQVVYACVDAHCAFLIGKDYSAWTLNRYTY